MNYSILPNETQESIREALKNELLNRCRRNPKYSLRAFSKALNMDPSLLSKVISGKRPVSLSMAKKASSYIDLQELDLDSASADQNNNYRDLNSNLIDLLSNWYFLPILELLQIEDFNFSDKSVARALSISVIEAKLAIDKLNQINLIAYDKKDQKWKCNTEGLSTRKMAPTSLTLANYQKHILQQAIYAIDNYDVSIRNQSTITVAIDTALIPEAKEKIKKFQRSLAQFLQKNNKNNEVYQLSLSLFPISNIKNESQNKKGVLK
jgi:transcriptional regulator with XRE-family HTH domain